MTEFELTEGEKSHPLWIRLVAHLNERLAAVRVRNDAPTLTEAETAALRGHIDCLKRLIMLGEPRQIVETTIL